MTKTALITGATGLLGANLVHDWLPRWKLATFAKSHRIVHAEVRHFEGDLTRAADVAEAFDAARPDVVVHCAACTDVDGCERDPARARRMNVEATASVATSAKSVGAKLVYVSTDALFSGQGRHGEAEAVDPKSIYAQSKLEGERAALALCPDALVLRTCIVGWNAQAKLSLAEWVLRELRAGNSLSGFEDIYFTPILCNAFGRVMEGLIAQGATGVLHAGGSECLSKYDFAVRVASAFGLPQDLVKRSRSADVKLLAPRPSSPCLDSSRCEARMGARMPDVGALLEEMRALEASGTREALRRLVA